MLAANKNSRARKSRDREPSSSSSLSSLFSLGLAPALSARGFKQRIERALLTSASKFLPPLFLLDMAKKKKRKKEKGERTKEKNRAREF